MARDRGNQAKIDQLLIKVSDSFSEWQRSLWEAKTASARFREGTLQDRQQMLYERAAGSKYGFLDYMSNSLGVDFSELDPLPVLPRPLTPAEAHRPPLELERDLWRHWEIRGDPSTVCSQISPAHASQPSFWTLCYLKWIEMDLISNDLISVVTGKSAERSQEMSSDKELDNFARTLMRNMGGLPSVRGSVSVFSNCPIARAWWRMNFTMSVLEHAEEEVSVESVQSLINSNPVWEGLVGGLVQRVAVFNEPRAYAALICYLLSPRAPDFDQRLVVGVVREVARYGLISSFALISWGRLTEIIHSATQKYLKDQRGRPALPGSE